MRALLSTAGECLAIRCDVPWIAARIRDAADGRLGASGGAPTMTISVEASRHPFPTAGWTRLSRDSWSGPGGHVVMRDVITSGLDLRLREAGGLPEFTFRWRPPTRTRGAAALLRPRARLLLRAALLQYPALWVAATRGRAPVHASVLTAGPEGPALLVGPSGVGKTTLVEEEVSRGGSAASDNLGVGDGTTVWGVVEPLRSERAGGRSAPHGRREATLPRRTESLAPQIVVALRRGASVRLTSCTPDEAARAIVASTYAAGELRRYWQLHALLALGTGRGPAHPPVSEVAAAFARRTRGVLLELPHVRGVRVADVLATKGAGAWT
jgi:hypothetical protein